MRFHKRNRIYISVPVRCGEFEWTFHFLWNHTARSLSVETLRFSLEFRFAFKIQFRCLKIVLFMFLRRFKDLLLLLLVLVLLALMWNYCWCAEPWCWTERQRGVHQETKAERGMEVCRGHLFPLGLILQQRSLTKKWKDQTPWQIQRTKSDDIFIFNK